MGAMEDFEKKVLPSSCLWFCCFLMCVDVLPVHMTVLLSACLQRPERGAGSLGTGVAEG